MKLQCGPRYRLYATPLAAKGREHERLAVEALVAEVFGAAVLAHHADGAPYIIGVAEHISVSHGGGYAVLAVSRGPIGVDIEAPRAQLERIRHKFMRPDDISPSLLHAWTAKEATFKAAALAGITIHDIAVAGNTATTPDGRRFALEYHPLGPALIALSHPLR